LHWKVAAASGDENAKPGAADAVGPAGPPVISVSEPVASKATTSSITAVPICFAVSLPSCSVWIGAVPRLAVVVE
jgi:hypothetical protein